jgi:hypothetical protein
VVREDGGGNRERQGAGRDGDQRGRDRHAVGASEPLPEPEREATGVDRRWKK